jgi:predicted NBD/HSP70 family sugar kinase
MDQAAEAATAGEPGVLKTIDEAARNLARVLSTTVAILDIHKVVITGVVARLGDPFLDRLKDQIEKGVLPTLAAKLELCWGRTEDRAVRMGAAALVTSQELGVV